MLKFLQKLIAKWNNFSKKRKFFCILVAFCFLILITGPLIVKANAVDVLGEIINIIIGFFINIVGWIATKLFEILLYIAQWNSFVDNITAVEIGWKLSRDLCNMFFIVILLVIAIGTILKIESYSYKKWLAKLVIVAIVINFSKYITGFLITLSQVVMLTFVGSFKEAAVGNIVKGLHLDAFLSSVKAGENAAAPEKIGKITVWNVLAVYVLALLFLIILCMVLLIMIVILVGRMVSLWVLTILSPFAYFFQASPVGTEYSKKWWQLFGKNLVAGPVLAFFLWLSFYTIQRSGTSITASMGGPSAKTEAADISKNLQVEESLAGIASTNYMIDFIVVIGLLIAAIKVTQEMGVIGSKFAGSLSKTMAGIPKAFMKKKVEKWKKREGLGYHLATVDLAIGKATKGILGYHARKTKKEDRLDKRAERLDQGEQGIRRVRGDLEKIPVMGTIFGGSKEYMDVYRHGPLGLIHKVRDVFRGGKDLREARDKKDELDKKNKELQEERENTQGRTLHNTKDELVIKIEAELKQISDIDELIRQAEINKDAADGEGKEKYEEKIKEFEAEKKGKEAEIIKMSDMATLISNKGTKTLDGSDDASLKDIISKVVKEIKEKLDGEKNIELDVLQESEEYKKANVSGKKQMRDNIGRKYVGLKNIEDIKHAIIAFRASGETSKEESSKSALQIAFSNYISDGKSRLQQKRDQKIENINKDDSLKPKEKKRNVRGAEKAYEDDVKKLEKQYTYTDYSDYVGNIKREKKLAEDIVDTGLNGGVLNRKEADEKLSEIEKNYNVADRKTAARKSLNGSSRDASRFEKESQELSEALDEIGKDIETKTKKLKADITAKIGGSDSSLEGAIRRLTTALNSSTDTKERNNIKDLLSKTSKLHREEMDYNYKSQNGTKTKDKIQKEKIDEYKQKRTQDRESKHLDESGKILSKLSDEVEKLFTRALPMQGLDARTAYRGLVDEKKKDLMGMDSNDELVNYLRRAMQNKDKYGVVALMEKMTADGNDNEFLNAVTGKDGKKYDSSAIGLHKFVQEQLVGKLGMNQHEALSAQNDLSYINEKIGHWETARTVKVDIDGSFRSAIKDLGNGKFDDYEHAIEAFAEVTKKSSRDNMRSLNRLAYGGERVRADGSGRDFEFSNLGKMLVTMLNNDESLMRKRSEELNINAAQNFMNPSSKKELELLLGKNSAFVMAAKNVSGEAIGVRADYETISKLIKRKGFWS